MPEKTGTSRGQIFNKDVNGLYFKICLHKTHGPLVDVLCHARTKFELSVLVSFLTMNTRGEILTCVVHI